jgi:hypothetical protein
MPGSHFGTQNPSKLDLKKLRNIYANHPKTIVNQYFGFSSILKFVNARNHHSKYQEVILEPKNCQNLTKRDYEIFTQITRKRS